MLAGLDAPLRALPNLHIHRLGDALRQAAVRPTDMVVNVMWLLSNV